MTRGSEPSGAKGARLLGVLREEQAALAGSIRGASGEEARGRQAGVLLVRLLALFSLQAGRLLDRDPDYLPNALARHRAAEGSFYRAFLLPLFAALAAPQERSAGPPIGRVPQLPDILSPRCLPPNLDLPDGSFARLFPLLSQAAHSGELNPDLLAAVPERQVGRKQAGVYYTGEDVAEYIVRATLLPAVLDSAGPALKGALRRQLARDPDRYLFPAARHGMGAPLPPAVSEGLEDPARRGAWNEPAGPEHALPTETWREHIRRRRHCLALRAALQAGDGSGADDLVTGNLDIRRVVHDLIARCDEPALLLSIWRALRGVTLLDPTCGTGAFLVTALRILEPLHLACLERMRALRAKGPGSGLDEPLASGVGDGPPARAILAGNLYGVDIQPEAAEACRLRLLLELAVRGGPAVRLNVAEGDILAGRASEGERPDWLTAFEPTLKGGGFDVIVGNPPYVPLNGGPYRRGYQTAGCGNLYALVMERAFTLQAPRGRFGMIVPVSAVSGEQFRPLARLAFDRTAWVSTYSNRPGKLFPGVEQRLAILLRSPGEPRVFSTRYLHWYEEERGTLFERLEYHPTWIDPAQGMPRKLGCALERGVLEKLAEAPSGESSQRGTPARGWKPLAGETVLRTEQPAPRRPEDGSTQRGVSNPSLASNPSLPSNPSRPNALHACWVHDAPTYWIRALPFEPNQGIRSDRSRHYRRIAVPSRVHAYALAALLSSSTFYLLFKSISNGRDCGRKELEECDLDGLPAGAQLALCTVGELLAQELRRTAARRARDYPSGRVEYEEYYPGAAKEILDFADSILAGHFGLTAEELDFVRNVDVKYRLGANDGARAVELAPGEAHPSLAEILHCVQDDGPGSERRPDGRCLRS